jgi:hypothetical protein
VSTLNSKYSGTGITFVAFLKEYELRAVNAVIQAMQYVEMSQNEARREKEWGK